MNDSGKYDYTFNGNDYECIIRITNGDNDLYLNSESWDDLYIEEDIFSWWNKGSITVKSPYDSFERASPEAMLITGGDDKQLRYKFRNDGRDTIFISIIPKTNNPLGLDIGKLKDELWRIELEAVIYDVEDLTHANVTDKMKKLFFWEKTYQLMREKNIEFTTATVGENKTKPNIHRLNNEERSLKTGEAIGELLINDEEFAKYGENYTNKKLWTMGDEKNKVFYTSPSNSRFYDDLNFLYDRHSSDESEQFQPCILKLERAKETLKPKQFSLMSLKQYFEKAGVGDPGEYQIEHLYLAEPSETSAPNEVLLQKSPTLKGISSDKDVKGEDNSSINNYQLVDLSGGSYSDTMGNRFITSFNHKAGQFNIEIKEHKSEKFQDFYKENIGSQVLTNQKEDRLPLTRYITESRNSSYIYSEKPTEQNRIVDGRNKLLQYYLFTNIGIAFSLRGLTIRQPGRFFALSKKTLNDKEFDHKLEGQYFITNIVHSFSPTRRGYFTECVGVKAHVYEEKNKMAPDDVELIK